MNAMPTNAPFNTKTTATAEYKYEDTTTIYLVSFYIEVILTIISVILMALGLFAIHLCPKKRNQNIILAALTFMEIVGE